MKRRDVLQRAAVVAEVAVLLVVTLLAPSASWAQETAASSDRSATGPLRVHPDNPRFFGDGTGEAVYLTGSHTWANFQERGIEGQTPDFDYEGYLDFMERHGHNFIRLWAWEHAQWMQFAPRDTLVRYEPLRYARTGPGEALDGKPKFDVTTFNPEYFERLRRRVERAGERGIYVAVMLFQGFSIEQKGGADEVEPEKGNQWMGHPFNAENNVNDIDGDLNNDGEGEEVHTLKNPKVTRLQEAYVRKVIDTVGDLDNVLWDITNESGSESTEWQYHMINFIHEYEDTKPKQHPVGMTSGGSNEELRESPAEWMSPNDEVYDDGAYITHLKPADGQKIVVIDTDHISPYGHNPKWAWMSFLRGKNFIVLDMYKSYRAGSPDEPVAAWTDIRKTMGQTRRFSERVELEEMIPDTTTASTGWALVNEGEEYLVYQPGDGDFTVDLGAGDYRYEWYDTGTGRTLKEGTLTAEGGRRSFELPPFEENLVLYLKGTARR